MTSAVFDPVPNSIDFPKNDEKILEFWKSRDVFKKSESKCTNGKHFVFYDGPPGTNGRPHIGHIMQSALKDVWPRFKTMQGYSVIRKAGWDTHGLPVELTAEAELKLKSKKEIEEFGVGKFIDYCRNTVLRFRDDWVQAISRVGRFLDFENDYLTMSNDFIQSDWWVVKKAWERNLLYKDFKVVPYCCRCGTGLSSHEVAQGYKDVTDLTITAKFKLVDEPNTSLLAWTTTPWTLLGNIALAVGGEIDYSVVKTESGEQIIVASELLKKNSKGLGKSYEVVRTLKGSDLAGKRYQPLWPIDSWPQEGDSHRIVADDYVTTEDGTGAVHLAMYGEDDFRLIKKNGFKQVLHVGLDGLVNDYAPQYKGRFFKQEGFDVDIVKDLAARGLLFDKYRHEHSYPHCWRCSTPLMYYPKSSWFIKTTEYRDSMLKANQEINWQPPHIKNGRFGKWLEGNVDWAVSRDRYWGSPLPIWTHEKDPSKKRAFSSLRELREAGAFFESTGKPLPEEMDLHLPGIDDIVLRDQDGSIYRREQGVLDCWFNAGIMPWGQFGYPEKEGSRDIFSTQFPADFICEAIDQTRGWFYTLLAVSCLVSDTSSFKNVICTELILDSAGKKMSKSLGNVIDPVPLVSKYGADAVRWTFYDSDPWMVKRYSEDLPKEALRSIFIPIWNCYSFFVTYANLDQWSPAASRPSERAELDRWILSALRTTITEVSAGLETYDIARVSRELYEFVDLLSNWYIRRSRKRFWKSEDDTDKQSAYATLYEVLVSLCHLLAPLAPFVSETMYQNLVKKADKDAPESVHLAKWPSPDVLRSEPELETEIAIVQEAASLARSLRTEHNLKVRQPLQRIILVPQEKGLASRLNRHLESLQEEVNVKEVRIVDDTSDIVTLTVKPNWPKLGPRFGASMKAVGAVIQGLPASDIDRLRSGNGVQIEVDGKGVELLPEDVVITNLAKPGVVAQTGKRVTVALTTDLTPELIAEGNAREILSVIQRHRKSIGLELNDNVNVQLWGDETTLAAAKTYSGFISRECLAKNFELAGGVAAAPSEAAKYDVNGAPVALSVKPA